MKNNYTDESQDIVQKTKKNYSFILWLIILFVILTIVTVYSFKNTAVFYQILACNIIILCVVALKSLDNIGPSFKNK
ncbi:MAG: hypothetical protein ACI8QQ_003031 [Psychroserpens sp.]|jgi:hypothetical protein